MEDVSLAVDAVRRQLVESWLASDSDRFADKFAQEARFVDALGRLTTGRSAIGRLHRRNFDSIHRNSKLTLEILSVRSLADGVALAHVAGRVHVPAGPLAGETTSVQTWILESSRGDWKITAFHNTHVRELAGTPTMDLTSG